MLERFDVGVGLLTCELLISGRANVLVGGCAAPKRSAIVLHAGDVRNRSNIILKSMVVALKSQEAVFKKI